MQAVAAEMNVSETAFVCPREDGDFDLRWFTPAAEVALCGHATLSTAHILWETGVLAPDRPARFHTQSGLLAATKQGTLVELDFPANPPTPVEPPEGLHAALGAPTTYIGKTRFDLLVELETDGAVRRLQPDFERVKALDFRGVIVTARSGSESFDIVSRFFAPSIGVNEDPVTGSAHTALVPYWGRKLAKDRLVAFQASPRSGVLRCTLAGDRVRMAGPAVTVIRGELAA